MVAPYGSARWRYWPVMAVVVLLGLASLACSLARQEEATKTPVPTDVLTPTFIRPNTAEAGSETEGEEVAPTIQLINPAAEARLRVNEEIVVRAIARHEVGATQIVFFVGPEGGELVLLDSQPINPQKPEAAVEFRWKPTQLGDFTLSVTALRGDLRGEPSAVNVTVASEEELGPQATVDLGPCTIKAVVEVSIRTGPGSQFSQRGNMDVNEVADGLGRNNDQTGQGWFKIRRNSGQEGWVNAKPEFVEASGGCATLQVVQP